jgi:transposase
MPRKQIVCVAAGAARRHHPATMLKIYLYGYLNRVQSKTRHSRSRNCRIEAAVRDVR